MADSNTRTQITVAVIGLIGVLAAAVIANWDKIFKKQDAQSGSSQQSGTATAPNKKSPPPEGGPGSNTLGDGPEGVMILEASPPSGTHLKQGQPLQFTVIVRYRLTSLEKATLSVGLVEYPNASG